MSVLTYNDIILPYAMSTQYSQKAIMDESSTDFCMTEFNIQVQCIINADYITLMLPVFQDRVIPDGITAAEIMRAVRQQLLEPRKKLSFKFNGKELLPSLTDSGLNQGTVDSRNGPQPQSCNVTQLTDTTFLLSYHIVARYTENNLVATLDDTGITNLSKQGNSVIYNRWSETVEIDNLSMSRRTREGKYVIRSDNKDGVIADAVRSQMAVVGIPSGFLRESAQYTQSPDGLAIQYRIVDREVFKMPPFPAFEAEGFYEDSTSNLGVQRWGTCQVTLKGAKTTPQNILLETAVKVATSKVLAMGVAKDKKSGRFLITDCRIRVDMYKNIVNVQVIGMMNPVANNRPKGRFSNIAGTVYEHITETPFSDRVNYRPAYTDRGSASILLQAAAYYDPSLNAILQGGSPFSKNNQPTGDSNKTQMNEGALVGTIGKRGE